MPVSEEIIKIVVCPKCKGKLKYNEQEQGFDCNACGLRYQIEDDIPNFLIDEALEIKANE